MGQERNEKNITLFTEKQMIIANTFFLDICHLFTRTFFMEYLDIWLFTTIFRLIVIIISINTLNLALFSDKYNLMEILYT